VRRLKGSFPDAPVLFTVTSRYGREMAGRLLGDEVDAVAFSPLDLPLFVRRFLDRFRPFLYVMVETDLWPNMVRLARRRGACVVLASGHASAKRSLRWLRPFGRAALGHVDAFFMQTDEARTHLVERGAPAERVQVLGNLKFDGAGAPVAPTERPQLRRELGVPEDVPVLVAGSTLAEDEGPLLDAVRTLREEGHPLHAVVAPRRQERVEAVRRACGEHGLGCTLRTEGGSAVVLILDTMGELARSYNVADAAYVGGGWTRAVGLHNIIEPALCGVPVLFGPHHGKARAVAAEFLRRGAGVEVAGPAELLETLRRILSDPATRNRLARAGRELLEAHRGAAGRQAERIRELVA
jgi:3-deoxy-D-manno-octulosonic-acid transferase